MSRKTRGESELQRIPGIGPSLERDLRALGVREIHDLRDRDPREMYESLCRVRHGRQDPCVLYVFRCAVYFATHAEHEPELLKWWNWTDARVAERESVRSSVSPAGRGRRRHD